MAHTCRHVFVTGRVQGVAFRWTTRDEAERLGVAGWVRNLSDGRVEAWIEGEEEAVRSLVEWLGNGPPGARVDRVEVIEASSEGLREFEVERSAV